MKTPDKLVKRVMDKMALRANQGMIKFGNTMEETKKTKIQWLKETQEELLDAAVYLEKCIEAEYKRTEKIVSCEGEKVNIKDLDENKSYGGTI